MARDNEDIYLKNTLDGFCSKLNAGLICEDIPHKIKRVSIIRSINAYIAELDDNPDPCEGISPLANMIEPPSIVCLDGSQEIDPEYHFIVGNEIFINDILYGWYDLNPATQPNPIIPNANDISIDIAANFGTNYTTDQWDPTGLSANIVNGQIAYHVIRMPLSIGAIDIFDEGGVKVDKAWTILSDSQYNYYVLMTPVAINADVTYILKAE